MATFNMETMINSLNTRLEPPIQEHLKNVYTCVAMSTLAAAVGGYVHLFTNIMGRLSMDAVEVAVVSTISVLHMKLATADDPTTVQKITRETGAINVAILFGNFITSIIALGFLIALIATPDDGKNRSMRLGFLTAFAFLSGLGLGPLLDVVISVDPAIIPTAFLSTCLIFICFTLSAIFTDHRKWIYIGGTLMSLLSVMLGMALINIFVGSYFLFKAQIYLGLVVMCVFILYDTQLIIEKRRRGDRDYIWHSVDLFIDLLKVFRYLMIILTDKERKKNKN